MGRKIRVPMAAVDGMRYREDDFEGLALSGRHVFCPQPDEAPHVVGKVGEPDLHAGSRKATPSGSRRGDRRASMTSTGPKLKASFGIKFRSRLQLTRRARAQPGQLQKQRR